MSHLINIDQVRAKNALSPKGNAARKQAGEGDALSGFPSLIINNGLIATVAYAIDKGGQHERIVDALCYHLAHLPAENLMGDYPENAKGLRDCLCSGDSSLLKRCTHESLEFLAYLKRFQRG
ncbi:MAG: type III-B CRISPR module-associated protein Cmr5 [Anaerolineales bacterium]|nr:type III-B CRISPR module-associated protein Cmr5 [Anaerolineales bacterium]